MITLYTSTNIISEFARKALESGLRSSFLNIPFVVNNSDDNPKKIMRFYVQVPDDAKYLNHDIKDLPISHPFVGEVQMFVSGFLWAASNGDTPDAK